jgi:hypothetical protein
MYAGGSLGAVMVIHAGQILSKVPSRSGDQHGDDILTSQKQAVSNSQQWGKSGPQNWLKHHKRRKLILEGGF